jgi:hypothetical protein
MPILKTYYQLLRYYIETEKINIMLFENPAIFDFVYDLYLKKKIKMDWYNLSVNPNPKAIDLLKKNPDKINWFMLSKNPNAIDLLESNPEKIDFYHLLENPNGFTLLEKYWNDPEFNLKEYTCNEPLPLINNRNSLPFIDAHWDELKDHISIFQFFAILYKDNVIPFLEKNWDELKAKISWRIVALNPDISYFIKKHWNEVTKDNEFWETFVRNPNVIDILEEKRELFISNIALVNSLYTNPAIFKLDQAQMMEQIKDYSENFSIHVNNPERLNRRLRIGKDGVPCDPLFDPDCYESLPHICEEEGEGEEMTCITSPPLFASSSSASSSSASASSSSASAYSSSQIKRSREYDDQPEGSNKFIKK